MIVFALFNGKSVTNINRSLVRREAYKALINTIRMVTHAEVACGKAFRGGLAIVGTGVCVEGVDVGQEGRELRWHSHTIVFGRKARKVATAKTTVKISQP